MSKEKPERRAFLHSKQNAGKDFDYHFSLDFTNELI